MKQTQSSSSVIQSEEKQSEPVSIVVTSTSTPTSVLTNTPRPKSLPSPTPARIQVIAQDGNVNVRGGPGTEYDIIGSLRAEQSLEIVGRNTDASWWQVVTQPEQVRGWVAAHVTTVEGDVSKVPVVNAEPAPQKQSQKQRNLCYGEIHGDPCLEGQIRIPPPIDGNLSAAEWAAEVQRRIAAGCYSIECPESGLQPRTQEPQQECIHWTNAEQYIGQTTCVWGTVTSTYDSGKAFFIHFSETDYSVFYGVSFDHKWGLLEQQCIILHGTISTYDRRPQIIINSPTQIESCD